MYRNYSRCVLPSPSSQEYRNLHEKMWYGEHTIGQECPLAVAGESENGHPILIAKTTVQTIVAGTKLRIYRANSDYFFAEMLSDSGESEKPGRRIAIPKGAIGDIIVEQK